MNKCPDTDTVCDACCREWSERESKDLAWVRLLETAGCGRLKCPCKEPTPADSSGAFSKDLNPFIHRYHPGAEECYRGTLPATGMDPGQQCCYAGKRLITRGAGGGTVDKVSVVGNPLNFGPHSRADVTPWEFCTRPWANSIDPRGISLYLRARPISNANGCSPWPASGAAQFIQ